MAEVLKLPRLIAAAKEFNVGQETLVELLVSKGFNRDELKPQFKLTEEMYFALQQNFQSDKVAKTKADQIEIPKSIQAERKRKEEEEITFRKEEPKHTVAEPVAKPATETPAAEIKPEPPKVELPKEEEPVAEVKQEEVVIALEPIKDEDCPKAVNNEARNSHGIRFW